MQNNSKGQKHVFCVDDDPEMLQLIEILLEDMGNIQVHQFTDAPSALSAMQNIKPDLVLLDVTMPKMNGIAAYQKIKADERLRDVRVVFVTARKRESDLAEYLALGTLTITKPFDPTEFRNLVEVIL